jgi:hypothetical protein
MAEERRKKITDEIEMEKAAINRSSQRSSSVDSGLDKTINKHANISYSKYSNMNMPTSSIPTITKTPMNKMMTRMPSVKIQFLQDLQTPRLPLSTTSNKSSISNKSFKSQKSEKNTVVIMPDPKQPETKEPEPEDLKRSIEIMIER